MTANYDVPSMAPHKQFSPMRLRNSKILPAPPPKRKEFQIKKRTIKNENTRNLRTGEPTIVARPLPIGEKFDEFFLSNLTATINGFSAPYREGRLPTEEVNWLSSQGTPKRGGDNSTRQTRCPRTSLGTQLNQAKAPASTLKKPTTPQPTTSQPTPPQHKN